MVIIESAIVPAGVYDGVVAAHNCGGYGSTTWCCTGLIDALID